MLRHVLDLFPQAIYEHEGFADIEAGADVSFFFHHAYNRGVSTIA